MKINYSSQKSEARIELVPLIDVVFCILTFFILAALALTRQGGINVDLPQASTGVTQMREMLLVSVDPVGLIYVEKNAVSEEELRQQLLDFRQAQPNGVMVLYASRLASYNDVVRVLDILRSVGGDRVALATLPETPSEDSGPSDFGNTNGDFLPDNTLPPGTTFTPLPGTPLSPDTKVDPQPQDTTPPSASSQDSPPAAPDPLDADPFVLPRN